MTRLNIFTLALLTLSCAVQEKYVAGSKHGIQSVIKHILLKNFTQDGSVFFLLSNSTQEKSDPSLKVEELPHTIQWFEDITLQIANDYLWKMLVHNPETQGISINYPYRNYILFINPQIEDFEDTFVDTLQNLKGEAGMNPYWNPRSKFILFAFGKLKQSPAEFAQSSLSILKEKCNIINAVLFIFTRDTYKTDINVTGNETNVNQLENITTIYAYTLFPYLNGSCNEGVTLIIGKWNVNNTTEDTFKAVDFFPHKFPKNFFGCVLNIGAFGPEPFVIKENYTTECGENKFALVGIGMELINSFTRKFNFIPNFNEPIVDLTVENIIKMTILITSGGMDIYGGIVPSTLPFVYYVDVSIPLHVETVSFIAPCPKPIEKTKKIIAMFSLSTWTSIGFVFIIVGILFWTLSNYPTRRKEFTGFNIIEQCLSAAWAVLLGISVPQMPLSSGTRTLFITYVWYCFAISTVFQAYFTTHLVEPGYETRLATFADAKRAGLKYGTFEILDIVRDYVHIKDLDVFETKEYPDFTASISSAMFDRQTFAISLKYYSSYLATFAGVQDRSKVECYLDEPFMTVPFGVALTSGHPLLDIFNDHIRRCLEGGLLEGYWSKIDHELSLKVKQTYESSEYVVFSLTHLYPVFMILLVGYILSFILFVFENIHFIITTKKNQINLAQF
ncbi:hypothetical protein L9F63_003987 [Diploptera punctata]|uniref:Uncharacterized protein n=1 Tax=Diploptera punctata TaxID=6984 RepID=A0AAD7ZHV0_DIPPU|nr:hypothetical protein L9F63_003987 [Diploptera punctata]